MIDWTAPNDHGSPITGYNIYIQQHDGTYTQESVECDGTSPTVIASTQCEVSSFSLIASPYNLLKDESVNVKVIAYNFYGDSVMSEAGNGAQIQLVPDAPVNLANDASITDAFKVGLTWSPGADDGGSAVIDYKLWYALENAAYVDFVEGIVPDLYTTQFTTEHGKNYKFKLQARNSVGLSLFSDEVVVRAARIPDPPSSLTTFIVAPNVNVDDMVISWTAEYDGGSPITAYKILIQESDGLTFTETIATCGGTD